ncbi:DUF371 domain-containing protein [Methanobacterium paludis]|uniref:DUF371 domain-containing protein n=1 Tax=Methanobacterium paludis (strain DSM 25820 / JCM 18151 / SWAN1) TaxID=868131 RepID=F6D548_METPW|nr:DUF371 domain-containing protein [Methanobacterium paludis]AEG17583.1 protein of unknown function DUF371 [Methanobacterium paludis]
MEYTFFAKGHPNVTSKHKTTFEVTKDLDMGIRADCIIGVSSGIKMDDFPEEIKEVIKNENTVIKILLETENAADEITGYGHPELTLDHPTDMVCRKSEFKCNRTLMIKADKAACDLKKDLINDLSKGKSLKVVIKVG